MSDTGTKQDTIGRELGEAVAAGGTGRAVCNQDTSLAT